MKCKKCGNDYEGVFCPQCGTKSDSTACTNCGIAFSGNFCPKCGQSAHTTQGFAHATTSPQTPPQNPNLGVQAPSEFKSTFLTGKLVIGIVSIILSLLVMLQSCGAGLINTIDNTGSSSGSMGMLLAFCWLIGGIVGIAARKSVGGTFTAGGFYLVGGLFALMDIGIFEDLQIWAVCSLAFAAVFIVSGVLDRKKKRMR